MQDFHINLGKENLQGQMICHPVFFKVHRLWNKFLNESTVKKGIVILTRDLQSDLQGELKNENACMMCL